MTPVVVVPMSDAERVLRLLTNANTTLLPYAILRSGQTIGESVATGGLPMLTAGAS